MHVKNPIKHFIFLFSFLFSFVSVPAFATETEKIIFFYGQGCPHCVQVEKYFEAQEIYTKFDIDKREVYFDRANAASFTQMLDDLNVPLSERGVPTIIVGDQVISGDKPIVAYFDQKLAVTAEPFAASESTDVEVVRTDLTLAAVVGASIVDAINPCAFAVLIILMSTIMVAGNNKKALKSGLAFSASIFISYFAMGLGLYKVLGSGNLSGYFYNIVGWLAIILGLLNLKDYFWYGKGFLMEVPMSWRPKLKGLISSVTSPLGAFAVGFLVSLFLLPCTSGPYIVILGMLLKNAEYVTALAYLFLYNLIFVLPMVLISYAVYKGFNPATAEAIRQKKLRVLHLVAGVVMLLMGLVIVLGWA